MSHSWDECRLNPANIEKNSRSEGKGHGHRKEYAHHTEADSASGSGRSSEASSLRGDSSKSDRSIVEESHAVYDKEEKPRRCHKKSKDKKPKSSKKAV